MSREVKDLIIIGGGPAGLSAAIYGKRAMLDELVIEKDVYGGGQIAVTDRVDNYLGLYGMSGYDIATKFKEHAASLEIPFLEGEVTEIIDGDVKEIRLDSGDSLYSKAIFLSTGAAHKKLGCKGEEKLIGAGVSYCATCDGAFFKGKTVAVVGGGDVALGDAIYLSNICKKVYLIHRRKELRGARNLQKTVFERDNIEFLPNYEVAEIIGDNRVTGAVLREKETNASKEIEISGIFIAVGMNPNSGLLADIVDMDENGYIVTDDSCRSSVKGIYAIGDIRTKQLRQVVTAVSDGAVAVSSLEQDELLA